MAHAYTRYGPTSAAHPHPVCPTQHHTLLHTHAPPGSLLNSVAQPIRDYLRGRSDTIKCLVTLVTQVGAGGCTRAWEDVHIWMRVRAGLCIFRPALRLCRRPDAISCLATLVAQVRPLVTCGRMCNDICVHGTACITPEAA